MKFNTFILLFFFTVGSIYSQHTKKDTFVIVHGAWGSSANFKKVDSLLIQHNSIVYRPCLTGMGERVHLASKNTGLETHILDVVNTILYEELSDIILVGHSYGGMVISGVADRIPNRIKKLIYLDAVIPNNGESLITMYGDEAKEAEKYYQTLLKDGFLIPPSEKMRTKSPPNDVPQPYKTFTDVLILKNELRTQKIPTYFIDCGAKKMAERAKKRGWPVYKLGNDHNVQWSDPVGLTNLLIEIANTVK